MPASEESEGGIGDDWGVGTIVWVRRRNGSWWPGRILGPEELTASHLMSPRSGTPVKLLGREDASVDWYNLEKSKRVKAFRCGEFNACIEKAEASQCVPIKKREKYARREDAILHALELEKQTSDIKAPKFVNSYSNKSSRSSRRDANIAFHSGRQLKYDESANHNRRVGSPSEGGIMSTQKRKGGTNGSGKNYLEATPRMRGLQDFGLQSAQASRSKDLEDTACRPLKKKRPQVGTDQDYVAKKRDRRRPLLKVLQSSAKIPSSQSMPSTSGPIACTMQGENGQTGLVPPAKRDIGDYGLDPSHDFLDDTENSSDHMQISSPLFRNRGSLVEENTSSGFNEANESSSTDNTSSDTDPETEEDETLCRAATKSVVSLSTNLEQYSDDMSFIDEDKYGILNESDDSSYIFQRYPRVQTADATTDMGGSKWNMKGKRNFRNLLRNPLGDGNRRISTSYRPYETRKERQMKSYFNQESFSYDDDYCHREDLDSCWTPNSNDRRTSPPKAYKYKRDGFNDSDEDLLGTFPTGWEIEDQLAYWEAEGGYLDPFHSSQFGEIDYMWFDVDLKVEVRYKGQHVPLVSLMSKLNGQAIVGHPLQVETLTDGSTDSLVPKKDLNEDSMNADGNATPPSVWRTGRRTAMQRIPRPHHVQSSSPDGKEADSLPGLDVESNPAFKRPHAVHFDNESRVIKTSHQNHKPAKFQKRPLKKPSLSNQKTRKLSSIAAKQRQPKSQIFDSNFTRVMKSELGAGPIVACVPVKVVFSRILEAVRRLPSTSTAKRGAL